MDGMPAKPIIDYGALTLQDMFDKANGGPGTSVVASAITGLDMLGNEISGSAQRIQDLMNQATASGRWPTSCRRAGCRAMRRPG
jgi:hypothetical protein